MITVEALRAVGATAARAAEVLEPLKAACALSQVFPDVRLARSARRKAVGCKGLIDWNSRPQTFIHGRAADPKMSARFRNGLERNSANSDGDQPAPVFGALQLLRRPSAIVRCVVFVGVKSINRMVRRRPRPHVREEHREVVLPSIAYANSPPAPAREILIGLPVAPRLHAQPCLVFRRSRAMGSGAVGRHSLGPFCDEFAVRAEVLPPLRLIAAAGWRGPRFSQERPEADAGGPALAHAKPVRSAPGAFARRQFLQHRQPTELFASDVDEFHAVNCIAGPRKQEP